MSAMSISQPAGNGNLLFEKISRELRGVKYLSNGGVLALCMFHDDYRPSLQVSPRGYYCFGCGKRGSLHELAGKLGILTDENNKKIVAVYDYCDATGKLLYQVIRLEPKTFQQRRPDGNGKWVYNLKGITPLLYRLPELLKASLDDWVFVVEGEKDVDRLASLGLVATTNSGGAGKWRSEFAEHFKDRRVAILPDNDEPGRRHAEQVARSLRGKAASIKVLELPGLPEKGDVSDWLAAGGTKDELVRLAAEAPEWGPPEKPRPVIVRLAEVEPEEVRWLWKPYMPLGKLTILEGDPGAGKSWLALTLAASVSRGWPFPGPNGIPPQEQVREPQNVLYLSAEDGLADTIRTRLDSAGADVSRVFALTVQERFFHRLGFRTVPMTEFPEKIARDCQGCARRATCAEIAVSTAPLTSGCVFSSQLRLKGQ